MNIVNSFYTSCTLFPENIAISEDDCKITYSVLYHQCLKVASYLLQSGIVNSFIAIEVDNTTDHIIAMLGILVSGNAYVSVTAENKVFFSAVDSLPVKLTITDHPSVSTTNTVCISDLLKQEQFCELQEKILREEQIEPKAPMCAFFTSGSTGKSKTIIHTHLNIFFDTMRQIKSNDIAASDKLDLVFSLSFSASLACIFPALLTGAQLAIFDLKNKGLHQLAHFWQQEGITFSTLSVSSFQGVCKIHPSLKHLHALRFISISAEPVKDTTVNFFKSGFPASTVLQIAYATTETRTISEVKIYNDGSREYFEESIGRPVEGKLVHITDQDGNCLPANAVGEITVVSAYIADSYCGQPEESKRSFSKKGDMVCYRTGDLGYLNSEGYLFYSGRSAYEYKLNGIKINVAEIEQIAEKVEGILTVAVVICHSCNGQQKLTCFFTATGNGNSNINKVRQKEEEIRLAISALLPPSHQPQFYIRLDQMPFIHSGKIDRKALEKIDPVTHAIKTGNSSPKHLIQEDGSEAIAVIIGIFKNILETLEIDEDSDFFDCGGDSLSSLVCIAEIETALNVALRNFALVSNPTPKKLGDFITVHRWDTVNLVETEALNNYLKGRRNLYFLHHLQDCIYDPLILGKLSAHFNLVMCYYDLRHIDESDNAANQILQELAGIIEKQENPIVLGYSISGYLAHQLACVLPDITCTMIDTYNYFEPERYQKNKGLQVKLKNLFWHVVQNKDFAYPWFLLRSKYEWIFIKKKKVWEDKTFFSGVNCLTGNLKNKIALHNCIYFQASRHHQDYGASWKSYVRGDFHYLSLKSTHHTIIKDHAAEISDYIVKTALLCDIE